MTTIKNVTEKNKKLQSFIGFLNANKIDHYNRGGKRWGEGEEKRIQKNLQNKSKHKKNKCFS